MMLAKQKFIAIDVEADNAALRRLPQINKAFRLVFLQLLGARKLQNAKVKRIKALLRSRLKDIDHALDVGWNRAFKGDALLGNRMREFNATSV